MKPIVIIDECLFNKKLFDLPVVFFQKGTPDEDIIIFANKISNQVRLFTKNSKDFNEKLKKGDTVISVPGKLSKSDIESHLHSAIQKSVTLSSFSNYPRVNYDATSFPTRFISSGTEGKVQWEVPLEKKKRK
jgi:hypothetical protein